MSKNPDILAVARAARSTRLASNAMLNSAGSLAYYAAVVIITPIAIQGLGERTWGIWQLVGALSSAAVLVNLGLSSAISYHVAGAIAQGDTDQLGKSIHTARAYMMLMGLVVGVLFVAIGPVVISGLVGDEDYAVALRTLLVSALLTALTLPLRFYPSVVSGVQRFDLIAVFRLAASGVLVLGVALGFHLRRLDVVGFAVLMTAAPAIPSLLSWFAARVLLPATSFRWRTTEWSYLKLMLGFSINTVLYSTGAVILFQSMKVIASWKAGGPVAAGHMGLAVSVAQILSVLFVPLVSVIHPRARDLASRGQGEELPRLVRKSLVVIGAFAAPAIIFIIAEAPLILRAWVGDALAPASVVSLSATVRWMMPGQWLFIVSLPCFYVSVALGKHRVFGVGMVAAGVFNGVAGWAATSWWPQTETLGAIFGLSVSALVLIVTVPTTLRQFRLGVAKSLFESVVVPAAASTPGLAALWFRPGVAEARIDLVIAAAAFGLLAAPGLLVMRYQIGRIEGGSAGNVGV